MRMTSGSADKVRRTEHEEGRPALTLRVASRSPGARTPLGQNRRVFEVNRSVVANTGTVLSNEHSGANI
jgi:hypothetical protein